MKKRIFIGMHYLEIGGAESALIGMLQSFDYSKVDVDLCIYSHQGALMRHIPKEVNLLPEILEYSLTEKSIRHCLRHGHWRFAWAWLMVRLKLGVYVRRNHPVDYSAWFGFMGHEMSKLLPDLGYLGEYDLAISFVVPHNFVLDHVRAKKKIGWIHIDYSQIDVCKRLDESVWGALDHIISISDDVTKGFLSVFPHLKNKIVKIENILSPRFVRRRADEFDPPEYIAQHRHGKSIICSMGRICRQKNFENVPHMANELLKLGIDFHWFVIGPGDSSAIESVAKELCIADKISFIGPRDNPYPYVKNCDVYVQPSLFEGKSVAVREAQMLHRPVVITNYSSASSQVLDGKDGIIVPLDNSKIAAGIVGLLRDAEKQKGIISYLESHDYGNEREIEKIYALLGN